MDIAESVSKEEGRRWREPEDVAAAITEGEQRRAVGREGSGMDASGEAGSGSERRWRWEEAGMVGSWTAAARRRSEEVEEGSQRTRSMEKGSGWRRKEGESAIIACLEDLAMRGFGVWTRV
jgi:hypothetical protein